MPHLTLTAATPLVAEISIDGRTARDVIIRDLDNDYIAIEFGGVDTCARITVPTDIIHALIIDADRLLTRRHH